jgi:septal ring factor EnvC (AmiA/AmiB activator)
MTASSLTIRHLCFTGPEKDPALLVFSQGLNVIYGASETGKSFIVEAIDFMLGGSRQLRDIPERIGYDRIFLGVETADNRTFTLVRSVDQGSFQLYDGLHESVPDNTNATVLAPRHSSDSENNLSSFLLRIIGLSNKRIRKNVNNITRSLSFRDICHLCIVTESEIQKQGSPIEGGQSTQRTAEWATFKLLLTGVDDSSLVTIPQDTSLQSPTAKLELIYEMLDTYRQKLPEKEDARQELTTELEKLEASISLEQQILNVSEEQFQVLMENRRTLRKKLEESVDRREEIDEFLARFNLLRKHYRSDLARLEGIQEAGSLLAALTPLSCPLCGAKPDQQHRDGDCDGNMEIVVTAANAESAKIIRLQRELDETIHQLETEAEGFDGLVSRLQDDLSKLEQDIQSIGPGLKEQRANYLQLVEKRASLFVSRSKWDQLAELEERRVELENVLKKETSHSQEKSGLSSSILDEFARQVQLILKAWSFPDADRVFFEEGDRDLLINGKRRSSRGKGMRAITHAAFIVGLLEYCKTQYKPHPGFVILDSPLLAYREPEGTEDDLIGTDVKDKFYEYLANWTDKQVIIVENIDPPSEIVSRIDADFFSKNPHQGRGGFFPITDTNSMRNEE